MSDTNVNSLVYKHKSSMVSCYLNVHHIITFKKSHKPDLGRTLALITWVLDKLKAHYVPYEESIPKPVNQAVCLIAIIESNTDLYVTSKL